jgi:D-glycero-alpha-D-manno-heptose 1-phosphate guanylyltransferase
MKAIILAGGLGTRLRHVVSDLPKPMVPVAGKPFLEYVVRLLAKQRIDEIILSVGYKREVIKSYFGNGARLGVNISYCEEETPLGTGGAVRKAMSVVDSNYFLIINGDTFNRVDFRLMESFHVSTGSLLTVALIRKKNTDRYGLARINDRNEIVEFIEKGHRASGYINCGIYIVNKQVMDYLPMGSFSFEQELFPELVGKGLYGYHARHFFIDIGIASSYRFINRHPALLYPL